MKFKGFLFDCDGTVIDSDQQIMNSWRTAMRFLVPNQTVIDADIKKYFGRTFDEAATLLARDYGVTDYNLAAVADVYWTYHEGHPEDISGAFPTVVEGLHALKDKGAKLGIVTSGYNASCAKELALFGLKDFFDVIIGADDVTESKPHPQPALLGCQKMGLEPHDVMLIGDSRNDIACGNRAGCTTALVKWTLCNLEQLEGAEKPDFVIDDLRKLLAYM